MKFEVEFMWLSGIDNAQAKSEKLIQVKLNRMFEDDTLSCGIEEYGSCGEFVFYNSDTTLSEKGTMSFKTQEDAEKAIKEMRKINRFYGIERKY